MTVTVLAVGRLGERHWTEACAEYRKRLSAFCKLSLVEIAEGKLPQKPSEGDIRRVLEMEGNAILDKLPAKARVIALCVEGKQSSSPALAGYLADAAGQTSQLAVVIGGSHGLSEAVKQAAHLRLSMSEMTFPHQLARVMVLEQLYRGFAIGAGLPYHK